jgi:hypothetical protein
VTYAEAQREFQIRLYRWAKIAQENEIKESFSSFRYVDEEFARTFLFFRSLDPNSQLVLGQGRLQVRHHEAAKALGEQISLEAQALMRREEAFRLRQLPGTWEGAFAPKNEADQPTKATRKQLKKAISGQFEATFANQLLPPDPLDRSEAMKFGIKFRGWTINTYFDFGRWAPEISCEHNVWNGQWITKDRPAVLVANSLRVQMNYGNEIGIRSGWEEIAVKDIEPTCAEIITHCRMMFDALTNLLEGLELGSLTT